MRLGNDGSLRQPPTANSSFSRISLSDSGQGNTGCRSGVITWRNSVRQSSSVRSRGILPPAGHNSSSEASLHFPLCGGLTRKRNTVAIFSLPWARQKSEARSAEILLGIRTFLSLRRTGCAAKVVSISRPLAPVQPDATADVAKQDLGRAARPPWTCAQRAGADPPCLRYRRDLRGAAVRPYRSR